MFKILKRSNKSKARLTILQTPYGKLRGPFFMPIATKGAVKNLTTDELKSVGSQILLSNTYHLLLSPGIALIKKAGGLHKFMNWPGPILTDSGGFQVFSLANHRKIKEKGVYFSDPRTGKKYNLSPEKAIQIQQILGSDIMMVLDECPVYPCTKKYAKDSLELTTRWAERCKMANSKWQIANGKKQLLFGIVQGSVHKDLRIESAKQIVNIGFDGYAIGGVAVGEPRKYMWQVLRWVVPELPEDKPRYLMGVGRPEEIVEAVKNGIDMLDCVIPTREARHGRLYIWNKYPSRSGKSCFPQLPRARLAATKERGKKDVTQTFRSDIRSKDLSYKTINITNAKFAKDLSPINNTNLKQYSKAYLHHLFRTNEPLGMRLATLNNLNFYLTLMSEIRQAVRRGKL